MGQFRKPQEFLENLFIFIIIVIFLYPSLNFGSFLLGF